MSIWGCKNERNWAVIAVQKFPIQHNLMAIPMAPTIQAIVVPFMALIAVQATMLPNTEDNILNNMGWINIQICEWMMEINSKEDGFIRIVNGTRNKSIMMTNTKNSRMKIKMN